MQVAAPPEVAVAGRAGEALRGLALVAAPVLLVLWLVAWPALSAVLLSLQVPEAEGLTLGNYVAFFADDYARSSLAITFWTTFVTAFLLVLVALPIALYLRFRQGVLPALVQGLALFPMFVPSIIVAYALIRTLGPNGTMHTVSNALGLPRLPTPYLTPWGPVIGLVWDGLPLTLLLVLSGLGNVSQASIDAARDVGAGPLRVLWHIVLPRIRLSLLVALSFNVLGIFSAFTLPYLLGPAAPELLGPFMQRTFGDLNRPEDAATQAVLSFLVCGAFGLLYVRAIARGRAGR